MSGGGPGGDGSAGALVASAARGIAGGEYAFSYKWVMTDHARCGPPQRALPPTSPCVMQRARNNSVPPQQPVLLSALRRHPKVAACFIFLVYAVGWLGAFVGAVVARAVFKWLPTKGSKYSVNNI